MSSAASEVAPDIFHHKWDTTERLTCDNLGGEIPPVWVAVYDAFLARFMRERT